MAYLVPVFLFWSLAKGLAPGLVRVHLVRLVRGKWVRKYDVCVDCKLPERVWKADHNRHWTSSVMAALAEDPKVGPYVRHVTDSDEDVMLYTIDDDEHKLPPRGSRGWLSEVRYQGLRLGEGRSLYVVLPMGPEDDRTRAPEPPRLALTPRLARCRRLRQRPIQVGC